MPNADPQRSSSPLPIAAVEKVSAQMTLVKEAFKITIVRWVVVLTLLTSFVLVVVRLLFWMYNIRTGGYISI